MKIHEASGVITVELTRRNLTTLLDKLDDELSARTIYRTNRLGRTVFVKAVEDDEHYAHRPPGEMYMPSTGETR